MGRKGTTEEGKECETSTTAVALFLGLPSPIFHTASNQKLKLGKIWEQVYHGCKRKEKGEWGAGGGVKNGKEAVPRRYDVPGDVKDTSVGCVPFSPSINFCSETE